MKQGALPLPYLISIEVDIERMLRNKLPTTKAARGEPSCHKLVRLAARICTVAAPRVITNVASMEEEG